MTEQRTLSVLLLLHSESFKESEMFNLIGNNPTIFNLELPHVQEVYVFVLSIFIFYLLPHSPSSLPHYLPLKVIQSVLHTSKIIRFCKSFSGPFDIVRAKIILTITFITCALVIALPFLNTTLYNTYTCFQENGLFDV